MVKSSGKEAQKSNPDNSRKPNPTFSSLLPMRKFVMPLISIIFVVIVYQNRVNTQKPEDTPMDSDTVRHNLEAVREMFYHSYDSYLLHAFPKDELAPISCSGQNFQKYAL